MGIYRNAGKKAIALLDPFAIPAKAFLVGIQYDKGGKLDDELYAIKIQFIEMAHTLTALTTPLRAPRIVKQHLHFYNGILKFIPSLHDELAVILPAKLTKIIQVVCICAYMCHFTSVVTTIFNRSRKE